MLPYNDGEYNNNFEVYIEIYKIYKYTYIFIFKLILVSDVKGNLCRCFGYG